MAPSKHSTADAMDMDDNPVNAAPRAHTSPLDGKADEFLTGTKLAGETQARQIVELTKHTQIMQTLQKDVLQKIGYDEAMEQITELQDMSTLVAAYYYNPTNQSFEKLKNQFPNDRGLLKKVLEDYIEKRSGTNNANYKCLANDVQSMAKFNGLEQTVKNTHAILGAANQSVVQFGHNGVVNVADYLRFVDKQIKSDGEGTTSGLLLDEQLDAKPEGITKGDFDELEAMVKKMESDVELSVEGKESDGDVFAPFFSKKEISACKNAAEKLFSYLKLLGESLDEIAEEDDNTETDSEELQSDVPSKKQKTQR